MNTTTNQLLAGSQRPVDPTTEQAFLASGYWRAETMVDDILENIRKNPRKGAIVTYREGSLRPETVTYGQLGMMIDRYAGAFIDLGVEKDDVVSIQLPNTWEFAVLALAAMRAGAVVNPLVAIFRHRELSFMLDRAQSKVLVVTDTFRGYDHAALAARLVDELDTLEHAAVVPRLGTELPGGILTFDGHFNARRWEQDPALPDELARRRRGSNEAITVMYTSGTTGEPKGTVHSYNSMWSAARPLFDSLGLDDSDVCFMASTMGHLTGFLWGMMNPLSLGMTVVFQEVWDADALVALGDQEGVTWTVSATPFVVDLMNAQGRLLEPGLKAFKYFVCGGGPIPSSLPDQAKELLGAQLLALWGSSESGIITIHRPGDGPDVVSDSDGWPAPPMELKVVDAMGRLVERGQEGRLLVRGPSLLRGYLGRMDLYDAQFDKEGWFDTGDLGVERASGGIRITGRSKDIIIRGGENIPVVEVENALYQHPLVSEVVVVGYPDERLGERGCAVVVPCGDQPPTLDDLLVHLDRLGMAKQYWPERLEVVTELPKTPSGKTQKFVLRDRLAGRAAGSSTETS